MVVRQTTGKGDYQMNFDNTDKTMVNLLKEAVESKGCRLAAGGFQKSGD
jgi:hypothetical protein